MNNFLPSRIHLENWRDSSFNTYPVHMSPAHMMSRTVEEQNCMVKAGGKLCPMNMLRPC